MATILNSGQFKTWDLAIINACQLYSRVTRVSDITTSDRRRIMLMGAYAPTEIEEVQPTKVEWPHQEKPDKSAWKIWTKALQTTICWENGQLFQALAKWNAKIEYDWKYYLSSIDNYLYSGQGGSWCRHKPMRLGLVLQMQQEVLPITTTATLCATMLIALRHPHLVPNQKLIPSSNTLKYTWNHGNTTF
jgi:hypothetical protein